VVTWLPTSSAKLHGILWRYQNVSKCYVSLAESPDGLMKM